MTTPGDNSWQTGDPEIDRALSQFMAETAGFEEVRRQIEETRGRGEGANGQVTVEVLATGSLATLRIDPRAMRLGSEVLAETILEAVRQAEEDVTNQMTALTQPLIDPSWGSDRR
ncbi:YbaB/EbfC family nucleoid-associated protein [Streptosporangium sp. NBC_01756]|uniref:YbaB/EbfC family nucleoid-associated protein n=1 Tax=Streptosporangium sp. NBC_01756 TaxID=2975950 RepID=UPI002DD7F933|nr:YbaB/EbfC family nucleoid-associated protein [Streptosporangium sp. NBC_01756]WSC84739.1 YbaB/EbfC family nucleoid-associated protein [Streptosporangium sp. NBC_01756]